MTKNIAALLGLAIGSAIGGTVSYGLYGTARDKGWNPWAAGALSGGTSAILGVGLALIANKLTGDGVAGLMPKPTTMRILSRGLSQSAVGALTPHVPRLGPMHIGAYVANPVGAYTVNSTGCVDCG